MPFGIPSEDFHGGFGLPHDEDNVIDVRTKEQKRLDAIEQDNYDPYTGKYAFVSPDDDLTDEEYEAFAEETHNNVVRALIESGGEIDSLKNDKRRLVYSLNETVKWLNYFLTHNRDDVYYDEAHEARWRAEYLLMDLEEQYD